MLSIPFPSRSKPYVGGSSVIATRYWFPFSIEPSSAAVAMTAGREYAVPFNLPGLIIDRIGIDVTTGAAGGAKIGIRADNNGVPGALLVDGGIIDTTSIATVEATIAAFQMPEYCWGVVILEAGPTIRHGVASNSGRWGGSTPAGGSRGMIATVSYATGLVAAPATPTFVSSCPMVMVRKS